MRITELVDVLAENALVVAEHLFPNGRDNGREYVVGSIDGEEGGSLKVSLKGSKAGIWKDFASDAKGGDLLDLWMRVNNCSLAQAMTDVCALLGIESPSLHSNVNDSFAPASKPKNITSVKGDVYEYLTTERGLSDEIISEFKVAATPGAICFPFIWANGDLQGVKVLPLKRKQGKKAPHFEGANTRPILYGWHTIDPASRTVIICEGEINAMSIKQMGFDALATPFGAGNGGKHKWIAQEYENLDRFETIYLWFDNDPAGVAARADLPERLGCERVKVIHPEGDKDANDYLLKGGDAFVINQLLSEAKGANPSTFASYEDIRGEVYNSIFHPKAEQGYYLPWSKIKGQFRFRFREVTLLAGLNGHGKSQAAEQMTLSVINQGGKVCVASMEFRPSQWMTNLVKLGCCTQTPSKKNFNKMDSWLQGKLFAYTNVGVGKRSEIIKTFRYARRRYGVRFFVVDNLTSLDVGLDDYESQRIFVQELKNFADKEDVHIVLIVHMRKPEDEFSIGNKYSIKGSGAISDLVDNVLIWHRNKKKEKETLENDGVPDPTKIDNMIKSDKQRDNGREFFLGLWFTGFDSRQFVESYEEPPYNYAGTGEIPYEDE